MKAKMLFITFIFVCQSGVTLAGNLFNCEYEPEKDMMEQDVGPWSLYLDQDLLLELARIQNKNEDRDYTMGLEYSISGDWVFKKPVFCQSALLFRKITKLFGDYSDIEGVQYFHAGSIGDTAFTPDNISSPLPVYNDRPYANLFYISLSEVALFEENDYSRAITSKLIVGAIGLNIGRNVQTFIHRHGTSPLPMGWGYQISNGGEPTLLFHRLNMRNYPAEESYSWKQPEYVTYWNYSLGYYVEAGSGFRMRWGNVNSPLYAHMSDPMVTGNHARQVEGDFYLFFDINANVNLYNALLQGQFRHSEVTYAFDEIRHFFMQGAIGVVKSWRKHSLSYVYHIRSSELKLGDGDRSHYFGGLYYSRIF